LTYRPVIDQFPVVPALDPWSAAVFVAVFIAAIALTARRPAYGLCALVAVTPFAMYRELFATAMTLPRPVLLGVLVGLTTYSGVMRHLRARPALLLLGAVCAYFVATALSAFDAHHPELVVREALKVVEYALFFIAAYLCYRLDPDAMPPAATLAAIVCIVSLTALAQEVLGAPSGLYVGRAIVPRVAGVLEGPNQLAGYFDLVVPVVAAWAPARRSALVNAALLLASAAEVLTFSRAGLVALAIAIVALVALYGRAMLAALRPVFGGAIAGLAVVAGWGIYAQSANVFRFSIESAYAGGVGNRSELWSAALRMFRAHPLLGVGAGNYELELPFYGVLGIRTHANSWYLQSLAEGGALLFIAAIGILTAVATALGKAVRRSPWIAGACAASLAICLHQLADYLIFFPKIGLTWWLLLGIAAAAA
jgi:O-antigen ligase